MRTLGLFCLLCSFAVVTAADPPQAPKAVVPPPKQIKFPDFPQVKKTDPLPAVKVDPAAPVTLAKGQYYVVASPKPLLVLPAGTGEVAVAERKPPFMLPAAQAIGWTPDAKDPEFVTWGDDYPFLYVVKGAKSGDVKLTVVPAVNETGKDGKQIPLTPKDVQYKLLAVDDGTGPRPPPPTPDPKVDPKVDPKPVDPVIPIPAKGFRVLFVYEKEGKLSNEQLNIANSSKIAAYLNDKCAKNEKGRPEWRKWDKTTVDKTGLENESALWQQVWRDAKDKLGELPQVVIIADQAGVTKAWPKTEDEMLALLKQYGG